MNNTKKKKMSFRKNFSCKAINKFVKLKLNNRYLKTSYFYTNLPK